MTKQQKERVAGDEMKMCCRWSYGRDGLQQTEVDAEEPIEVFVRKPEALHVKVHLCCSSEVRHFLGQDVTAQHQRKGLFKVLVEEVFR